MQEMTIDQKREFAQYMAKECGGILLRKDDDILMSMIGEGFDKIRLIPGVNLPSKKDFLENYATTVGWFIWIPDSFYAMSGPEFCSTVAHECQHVLQFKGETYTKVPGGAEFFWLYLTAREGRVRSEAEAERAYMETYAAMTGTVVKARALSALFEGGYFLDPPHINLLTQLLNAAEASIKSLGVASTTAGRNAVNWLARHDLYKARA